LLTYNLFDPEGDDMDNFQHYLYEIKDFFRQGFHEGFAHVSAMLGLIIALFAAYLLDSWRRIWAMALGATVIHLIAEVMLPVIVNRSRSELPPKLIELSYWRSAAALYLGYLIVIAVFFFIKRKVMPRAAAAH
jgi:hypothetical protein